MAVLMEVDDNQCYKLGTKQGILSPLYVRSQFRMCAQSFINLTDVPEKIVTLRSTASAQSIGSGQGFVKCPCETKCKSNRCIRLNSMPCVNKYVTVIASY